MWSLLLSVLDAISAGLVFGIVGMRLERVSLRDLFIPHIVKVKSLGEIETGST